MCRTRVGEYRSITPCIVCQLPPTLGPRSNPAFKQGTRITTTTHGCNDAFSRIPVELTLIILSHIDDLETCRTCRLVSQRWNDLFLPRVFRSPIVNFDAPQGRTIYSFHAFVATHGDIARCIHRLTIRNPGLLSMSGGGPWWRSEDIAEVLWRTLRQLPNLEHLSLSGLHLRKGLKKKYISSASCKLNLRSLEVQLHGIAAKPSTSSMLSHLLALFETIGELRVTNLGGRLHNDVQSPAPGFEPSPLVTRLEIPRITSSMPDSSLHYLWLGRVR